MDGWFEGQGGREEKREIGGMNENEMYRSYGTQGVWLP